tara:strand:- start:1659 stop:3128 length:1470 start_codon:yes stop_codon:yes gene_type:complete
MKPTFDLADISAPSGLESFLKAYHADLTERYDWQAPNIGKSLNIASKILGYHSYPYYLKAVSGSGLDDHPVFSLFKMQYPGVGHDFYRYAKDTEMAGPYALLTKCGWKEEPRRGSGSNEQRSFSYNWLPKVDSPYDQCVVRITDWCHFMITIDVGVWVDDEYIHVARSRTNFNEPLSVFKAKDFLIEALCWRDNLSDRTGDDRLHFHESKEDCISWKKVKTEIDRVKADVNHILATAQMIAFNPDYMSAFSSDWVDDEDTYKRYRNFSSGVDDWPGDREIFDRYPSGKQYNFPKTYTLGTLDGFKDFLTEYHKRLNTELCRSKISNSKVDSALLRILKIKKTSCSHSDFERNTSLRTMTKCSIFDGVEKGLGYNINCLASSMGGVFRLYTFQIALEGTSTVKKVSVFKRVNGTFSQREVYLIRVELFRKLMRDRANTATILDVIGGSVDDFESHLVGLINSMSTRFYGTSVKLPTLDKDVIENVEFLGK